MSADRTPHERLRGARLLALDVDGVLTDGRVVYSAYGPPDELQHFDVQDGIALRWLIEAGVVVTWITGRGCLATTFRARELGVEECHTKVVSKRATLRAIQERLSIGVAETVAMGDDLPDLGLRAQAGVFVAPANARDEIKARADWTVTARGGAGAVRELAEAILRARGRWDSIVEAAER
ncbi:MAG: KdsC family phosphatase [Planctomycetota bacterium]